MGHDGSYLLILHILKKGVKKDNPFAFPKTGEVSVCVGTSSPGIHFEDPLDLNATLLADRFYLIQ